MQINSVSQFSNVALKNKINANSNISQFKNSVMTDTVSFSAKRKTNKPQSPEVQIATKFASDILNVANSKNACLADVKAIASRYTSNVDVLPISQLGNFIPTAQNYGAFFTTHVNEDFSAGDKKIYVSSLRPMADKTEKLLFAMNCSHEFTHLKQADTNRAFDMLKEMSGDNYEYGKLIMSFGDSVFSFFDNDIQAHMLAPIMRKTVNPIEMARYGVILPKEASFTKEMIPYANGVKSVDEFKKVLSVTFDELFSLTYNNLKKNQSELMAYIPSGQTYDDFKQKVKEYCALKANNEVEAYTTESIVAKKALNTNRTLNIDAFPAYYQMLNEALN